MMRTIMQWRRDLLHPFRLSAPEHLESSRCTRWTEPESYLSNAPIVETRPGGQPKLESNASSTRDRGIDGRTPDPLHA